MTTILKLSKSRYHNFSNIVFENSASISDNIFSEINTVPINTVSVNSTTSSAVSQAFSNAPTFTAFPLVMAQKQINAPTTITINRTGAVAGASVLMRLIADGVSANTPVFVGAEQVTGSSGWDNRTGIINLVQIQFDGTDFYFSIVQKALGAVLDLQAPTFVSSTINTAGTIVTLTFNEDLLATSVPTGANFTGATVTSASVLNKVVTLNINPEIAVGTTNIVYSGVVIKDLAGNSSSGFTTSLTVAPVSIITPVNLDSRQAGIDQVSVGTYKNNSFGWRVAMSSTLNFVGGKTFETSEASLAGSGAIIGLDTRTVADANIAYTNVKYWIGYYGGSYKAATNGSQTGALAGYVAGDKMQLKRTGTNLVAQLKRADGTIIDLFTWTGVSEPLSTLTILDDNLAQISLTIK